MTSTSASPSSYMDAARRVIDEVVAPSAPAIDQHGTFPRPAIEALGQAGVLGLVSAREVGGMGEGPRAATLVVEALAGYRSSADPAFRKPDAPHPRRRRKMKRSLLVAIVASVLLAAAVAHADEKSPGRPINVEEANRLP